MAEKRIIDPDLGLIRKVKAAGGDTLKNCYQCATCSVVCNLSPTDKPFPRKEMIWAQWGQTDRLMADPDVWLCHQCNDCSAKCPRGARPGDVLAAIRTYAYEHFAFPRFMGRSLPKPAALPLLLLVPTLVMIACIMLTAPRLADGSFEFMSSSTIDFNLFLPHSSVDAVFVFGNILIFLFAAIGFKRFWNALQSNHPGGKASFIGGLIAIVGEIATHKRFSECEANKARWTGHILLLYGFLGAMMTTGAVFVFIFIPHSSQSYDKEHIKEQRVSVPVCAFRFTI